MKYSLIIPSIVIIILFSGWINECYPYQYQYGSYYFKSQFITESVKDYGFVPLWSNEWYNGFPFLLYYPPLFNILVGLLGLLINTLLAQNLVMISCYALIPISVYLFLKRNKVPANTSLITTILFISSYTFMTDLVWIGNSIFYLALSFSLLGLSYVKDLNNSLIKHSLLTCLTILVHPAITIFHGLMTLLLSINYGTIKKALISLGLAVMMAATWLLPFIINLPYASDFTDAGLDKSITELINLVERNIALMIILGASIIILVKSKKVNKNVVKLAATLAITTLLLVILGSFNFILVRMVIILPLAISLIIGFVLSKYLSKELIIASLILISVFVLFNNSELNQAIHLERLSINNYELILSFSLISLLIGNKIKFSKKSLIIIPCFFLLFSNSILIAGNLNMQCFTNISDNNFSGRVLAFPHSQGEYLTILPAVMDVKLSGGGIDQAELRKSLLNQVSNSADVYDYGKLIGADHLLMIMRGPSDIDKFMLIRANPNFIPEQMFTIGLKRAYLFKIVNNTGYTNPLVGYMSPNPEEVILFTNFSKETELLIRETYFPYWKAFINDSEVMITETSDHFMKVSVPTGPNTLRLNYNIRSQYLLGFIISLIGLSLLLLLVKH